MPECRGCHAPIFFAVSTNRVRTPINMEPDPAGNVILDGIGHIDGVEYPLAVVLGPADVPFGDPPRYQTHFATCPNAGDFKKKGMR